MSQLDKCIELFNEPALKAQGVAFREYAADGVTDLPPRARRVVEVLPCKWTFGGRIFYYFDCDGNVLDEHKVQAH